MLCSALMTLLIREAEVEQLVTMPDVIEAVEASERALGEGRAIHHPRERVRLPGGMLHLMAGGLVDDDLFGFKAYTACGRGPVRFKVARRDGRVLNAQPEFEDLAKLSAERGIPVKEVQALAQKAWLER